MRIDIPNLERESGWKDDEQKDSNGSAPKNNFIEKNRVPPNDILITNPPFSTDHMERHPATATLSISLLPY